MSEQMTNQERNLILMHALLSTQESMPKNIYKHGAQDRSGEHEVDIPHSSRGLGYGRFETPPATLSDDL